MGQSRQCVEQFVVGVRLQPLESAGDIDVVAEAPDGLAAVRDVARLAPDVVLMDVRMPAMDGIEATPRIVDSNSNCRVVMLTTFDQDENVYGALRAGASGFLLKSAPPDRIIEGVRMAADGESLFAPSVTKRLVEHYVRGPPVGDGTPPAVAGPTERELEVLRLLAVGQSNRKSPLRSSYPRQLLRRTSPACSPSSAYETESRP